MDKKLKEILSFAELIGFEVAQQKGGKYILVHNLERYEIRSEKDL